MASTSITHCHVPHALTNPQHFADLQGYRDLERITGFDDPILSMQERIQTRAKEFLSAIEKNLGIKEGDVSPLRSLLQRTLQIPDSEENAPVFATITKAFFKQKGYFPRLFSGESWEEWTENRTPLGKATSQLRDCMESNARVSKFVQSLDKRELQQANKEAEALINTLDLSKTTPMKTGLSWRDFNFSQKSSCATGLISGVAASLATKNPLPLLVGLSQCLPNAIAQEKLGNEFRVNTNTNFSQSFSSLASFPNGNFIVTWVTWPDYSDSHHIYGQLFNRTGYKIGTEFQVTANSSRYDTTSSVVGFNNENFIVAFRSDDSSGYGIAGQLFTRNTSKIGNKFQVNTYTSDGQSRPSVASFPNGNFVVTWQSWLQDGSNSGIYGQLFTGNASKIGSEFRINTYTDGYQSDSSVSELTNGNFVVAWYSDPQDGSDRGIYGQLFDENASKVGNEFLINTYTNNSQSAPSIASLTNGNFVVTWESVGQDGSDRGIYGQLFDENASKVRNEFPVNTYTNNSQSAPSIASITNGNFVVTWMSFLQDTSGWGIYGQLFDSNINTIGNEFPVNTYTNNSQSVPSIASLTNGSFVVTWESMGQDGSGSGVYGQIFTSTLIPPPPTRRQEITQVSETSKLSVPTAGFLLPFLLGRVFRQFA